VALAVAGCAQVAVKRQVKAYENQINPMVGKATREEIALEFGPPDQREQIGQLEIWQYHTFQGYRAATSSSGRVTRIHERSDHVTFYFDAGGILTRWKVYVTR